ncbi:MAG: SBBP repeat-containing protein, partial [Chloroflexota bacterium]
MNVRALALLALLALLATAVTPAAANGPLDLANGRLEESPASLLFIENVGQFDGRARFQARSSQGVLWLAQDALWVTVWAQNVNQKLTFSGANPAPRLQPFGRQASHVSYFTDAGRFPDVPVWAGVLYEDLYPGIDLVVTGENGQWVARFLCAANCPGALERVRPQVEGADSNSDFGLPILEGTEWLTSKIQNPKSKIQTSLPLVYSTFLGGSVYDEGFDIFADDSGTAYVAGSTQSPNFPTTPGVYDPTQNGSTDAFVVQLNADGTGLLFATFVGGSGADTGWAMAVKGEVYLTGFTQSTNFPVTAGAYDTTHNGNSDVYVAKLSATGAELLYATYLGGSGIDDGRGIGVDGDGNAYVAGYTASTTFPTTAGAFDTTFNGIGPDAYVTKLNAAGTALVYSTFLGGSGWEWAEGLDVNAEGFAFVTGRTDSALFPTTDGSFDTTYNSGFNDGFVTKINQSGSALSYSAFLGGNDQEEGNDVVVDGSGNAYVTGYTYSGNFPVTDGAYDTTLNGSYDVYVVKVNSAGSALSYGTFVGGSSSDEGYGITVGAAGNATVTGFTGSSNFPTTAGAVDTTYNGGGDAFMFRLNEAGSGLNYGTFLGSNKWDYGNSVDVDASGRAYLTGFTQGRFFPTTTGAYDTTYNGGRDA